MKLLEINQSNGSSKFTIENQKKNQIYTYFFDEYSSPTRFSDDQPQWRRFDVFERVCVIYAYPEIGYRFFEHEHYFWILGVHQTVSFFTKSSDLEQCMTEYIKAYMLKRCSFNQDDLVISCEYVPKSTEKYVFSSDYIKYSFYKISKEEVLTENPYADIEKFIWLRVKYRDKNRVRKNKIIPFPMDSLEEENLSFSEKVRLCFLESYCFLENHFDEDLEDIENFYNRYYPRFMYNFFTDYGDSNIEDFCIDCHYYDKYEIHPPENKTPIYGVVA